MEPEQPADTQEITSQLRNSRHLRNEGELLSLTSLVFVSCEQFIRKK